MRGIFAQLPVRLVAFVVIPLLLAVGLLGTLVLRSLEGSFERRLQREVEMVARALQEPLSDAMSSGRQDRVQRILESTLAIGRVYGVYVYDAQARLRASVGHENASPNESIPGSLKKGRRTGTYGEVGGRSVYSYFVPLSASGGRIFGLLQVTRKESDFRAFMGQLRAQGVAVGAVVAVVLTMIVLIGYYGAAGRSLRTFATSIRRVDEGDRSHRATIRAPREIATVAQSFNAMLDSMTEAELQASRERSRRAAIEERLRRDVQLAAIGKFSAGLAHELGAPVSIADGYAQRILRDPALDDRIREPLGRIRAEIRRMETLVRKILDYGRSRGQRRAPIDVGGLVGMVTASLTDEGARRGVAITAAPPSSSQDSWIVADEARIEQALLNLCRNAIQAACSQVRVAWSSTADAVELTVDDDGPGISEQVRERLYEPFVTTRGHDGGTGLGLAIAHAVAIEHKGTIRDEASPLGGARFRLSVCRRPEQQGATER